MRVLTSLLFFLFSSISFAQLKHPKASPAATITQEVGFSTIKVEYSRPAVRGRKIFGDLVPYGRIWRVGANESTKISFDTYFNVGANNMPPGTYTLYAFPNESEWEVVFHHNISHWGDGRKKYNSEEDAFRIKVEPNQVSAFQENFLISFDQLTHDSVNMIWHWSNTSVTISVNFNTTGMMEEQIKQKLIPGAPAQTYYEAARFYVEQNMKYDEALIYLNKAIELGGDTYYYHRVKSLAEVELGDYKAAIKSAKKSLELAQLQDKDEFVRMNQKNIDLWNTALKSKN
jgi:tetratricopeptide (TPR) repeat protein